MPHLRSHGPVKHTFEEGDTELETVADSSAEVKVSTVKFDFTPHPTPHNTPPSSPRISMAANRTVHQQAFDGFTGNRSSIATPAITNPNSWQIPSYIMTAIANDKFHGRDDEDAPAHLSRLARIVSTFKLQGASDDAIYLHLFPFSLADRAIIWLDSQAEGTFTTWEALRSAFLKKYFPPAKASRLRDQIHSFRMEADEPYYLAWERFQNLLSRCSQHGLTPWALVEKFYNGLTYETRARFDTSAGGHLMGKMNVDQCNELFESFAQAEHEQRSTHRNSTPVTGTPSTSTRGLHHVSMETSVAAALENLTREMRDLKAKVDKCERCRGGHSTLDCPLLSREEQVEFVANQNRFPNSNSGNSNWNRNSNFNNSTWRSSGAPPGYQSNYNNNNNQGAGSSYGGVSGDQANGQGSGDSILRIEQMLMQLVTKDKATQETLATHELMLKKQELALQNQHSIILDIQRIVGDLVKQSPNQRPQGQFSGSTQTNPSAQLNAISTRSGRVLEPVKKRVSFSEPVVSERVVSEDEEVDEEIVLEGPGSVEAEFSNPKPVSDPELGSSVGRKPVDVRPSPLIDHARVPYPARLKQQKYTREYGHFLDMFKQIKINLPFIEVLQQMPKYAKFLKDILKNKCKLGDLSSVPLSGECSAVVTNTLPEKLSDPGVFTIPCLFGSNLEARALADLGASINLMPYSLYEKLGLGELTPTNMSLSLADKSIKYPRGIVENLLVKVDKFVFPVDFVVLDMEADAKVPIILGRPFLRTAHANIDVFKGQISLQVGEEIAVFKIPDPIEKVKRWDSRVQVINAEDRWVEGYESGNVFFTREWAEVKQLLRAKCGDPSRFKDTPDDAG
ncbi:hypothetical protein QVD17_09971 [Tagetes erecta]|nr:hypothetical protein QVD17_09970 [Tagetes erecta]KAK1433065.1 hypothetical protein QVD17_09971 [Tagetes erecta]